MVTYFNKKDLVSFGAYLLSEKRRARFRGTEKMYRKDGMNPLPAEEALTFVHDADLANWLDEKRVKS